VFSNARTYSGIISTSQKLVGMVILVVLAGCGTLYELEINASNPRHTELGGSYVLVPMHPSVVDETGDFEKYFDQIERGLSGTELRRVPLARLADADVVIFVSFGISEPEYVGYSSKTPMFQESSRPQIDEGPRQSSTSSTKSGSSGAVDPPPEQDFVGTHSYTFVRTKYWRDLFLFASTFDWDGSDISSIQRADSLWSVSVSTRGSSANLDEVMPVMIAAAKPYVGVHSKDLIVEKMNGIDSRIKAISEGK
jgi:hypothetical protein